MKFNNVQIPWDALPFRSDPVIETFWPDRDLSGLAKEIEEDGGIRDALLVAKVKGDNGKPILFDGRSRLRIAVANAYELPPAFQVVEFDSIGEVYEKVRRIQSARRNVTAPQMVVAWLQAQKKQGFDISPQQHGGNRSKRKGSLENGLKPLPSAKLLAQELGVSAPVILMVKQVLSWNDDEVVNRILLPTDDKNHMGAKEIQNRINAKEKERKQVEHDAAMEDRKLRIQQMPVIELPDAIQADGLFTTTAVEGIKRLPPESIDLVVTSIPYALDKKYDVEPAFDGDYQGYLDRHVRQWLSALKPALKRGGRVAINFDNPYPLIEKTRAGENKDEIGNFYNVWADISVIAQKELGYLPLAQKSWYKQTCPQNYALGSYDSEMPMENPFTEYVLIFAKDSVRLSGPSDISQDEYNRFALNVWYIKPQERKAVDDIDYHSCPFPEELAYRLIRRYSPSNGTILDPYNGSGTTTFVAAALGRNYIGIDSSALATESATKRLQKLDGLTLAERYGKIARFMSKTEHVFSPHTQCLVGERELIQAERE